MKIKENNELKQTRTTIQHLRSPQELTIYQVTHLAVELSRKADGTIDRDSLKQNGETAFEFLAEIKQKIEQNANLPTE
jgi:hypothetical protein